MTAYIAVSMNKRKSLEMEIVAMMNALTLHHIMPLVFVDQYEFSAEDESAMMHKALADIDACDILIAETSAKAIGVGIESGYAKGKGKIIVYVRSQASEHSTTLSGIADYHVIYSSSDDLHNKLNNVLDLLLNHRYPE
jgi:2'-deoxynucleoside 5'-phosphate N-hydrolase